jgi:hypothetical protein
VLCGSRRRFRREIGRAPLSMAPPPTRPSPIRCRSHRGVATSGWGAARIPGRPQRRQRSRAGRTRSIAPPGEPRGCQPGVAPAAAAPAAPAPPRPPSASAGSRGSPARSSSTAAKSTWISTSCRIARDGSLPALAIRGPTSTGVDPGSEYCLLTRGGMPCRWRSRYSRWNRRCSSLPSSDCR